MSWCSGAHWLRTVWVAHGFGLLDRGIGGGGRIVDRPLGVVGGGVGLGDKLQRAVSDRAHDAPGSPQDQRAVPDQRGGLVIVGAGGQQLLHGYGQLGRRVVPSCVTDGAVPQGFYCGLFGGAGVFDSGQAGGFGQHSPGAQRVVGFGVGHRQQGHGVAVAGITFGSVSPRAVVLADPALRVAGGVVGRGHWQRASGDFLDGGPAGDAGPAKVCGVVVAGQLHEFVADLWIGTA